ncbi:hypothetical protein EII25_04845 [Erysipelotrichaceae bacterium OH741_COT-311]|nr:hypothetical protein EII25_04845 [Erysipelotrichaceae bacterium OH741_COT-311]
MKKYIYPILTLICLSIGLNILPMILSHALLIIVKTIFISVMLFIFGMLLNVRKRSRYESWFKKVVLSFLWFFFLFYQFGYIMIPQLHRLFQLLGIQGNIIYFIYIYLGWAFFD